MKDIEYYSKQRAKFKFKCQCGFKTTNRALQIDYCPNCGMSVYDAYRQSQSNYYRSAWHETEIKSAEFCVDQCEKLGIKPETVLQIKASDLIELLSQVSNGRLAVVNSRLEQAFNDLKLAPIDVKP